MIRFIVLFILVFCHASQSQNLVPNPGFDVNVGCPNQIGQIDKADGWSVWGGTPDYFHSCSNSTFPIYGTPYNNRGFRTPRSGDAYVGLFTHTVFTPNGREFIGRPLSTPLIPGIQYFVSMYVCQADVAVLGHSTNNIGVRFSTVPFSLVNPDTALNNAHVWISGVVTDSVNWVRVSGSFVADSAYTHIGIGNYFSDSLTTIIPGTALSNYAYYMIDDVCVSDEASVCDFSTSIPENINGENTIVFPNPAQGKFKYRPNKNVSGLFRIYDITGKQIFEREINMKKGEEFEVILPDIVAGLYTIVVNEMITRIQIIQ